MSVSVLAHQAKQSRKAKGVVAVSVCEENFVDFSWSDGNSTLNLKLCKNPE